MDEVRLQIRNALLHGANILGQMESLRGQQDTQSDRSRHRFGEDAQNDALAVLQQSVPPDIAKSLVAEIAGMLRNLPPRDDRSLYDFWVLALNLQIIRHIARNYYPKTPLPWLDTLGIGHVNASVKAFGGEYVLVFQSGTKAFTNLVSKVLIGVWKEFSRIVHGHPELTAPDHIRKVLQDIDATQAFGTLLHAYLFLGHPVAGTLVLLDERSANVASHLETAMDRFIVGHEYAHVLRGHHPGDEHQYENELEADSIGLALMLESMQEWDNVISFCGAYLIVVLHDIIMRAVSKIQGYKYSPSTYPSGYHRCVNLLATCERKGLLTVPMEQIAIAEGYKVGELYNIIEPGLLKEASKPRRLASIWT